MPQFSVALMLVALILLGAAPVEAGALLRVTDQKVEFYYLPNGVGLSHSPQSGENRPRQLGRAPLQKKTTAVKAPPPAPEEGPPLVLWQLLPRDGHEARPELPPGGNLLINLTSLRFFQPPQPPRPEVQPEPEEWSAEAASLPSSGEMSQADDLAVGRVVVLSRSGQRLGVLTAGPLAQARPLPPPGNARVPHLGPYCFPVAQPYSFRDSWGDPREGGRYHRASDIAAPEGTEVYAVTSGTIHAMGNFNRAGLTVILRGQDGRGYAYMHLMAFVPGLAQGKTVKTGEVIGYVGRTGTQNSAPHLHFEVYPDHRFSKDSLVNPYDFLVQLSRGVGVADQGQRRPVKLAKVPNRPQDKWLQVSSRPWSASLSQPRTRLNFKIPLPQVMVGGPTHQPGPPQPVAKPPRQFPGGSLLPSGYSFRLVTPGPS